LAGCGPDRPAVCPYLQRSQPDNPGRVGRVQSAGILSFRRQARQPCALPDLAAYWIL